MTLTAPTITDPAQSKASSPATAGRAAADIVFNPLDPAFREDPYPVYARLRAEAPVLRTKGTLILSRYEDVVAILRSRKFSVSLIPDTVVKQASRLRFTEYGQMLRFLLASIVFTDNPDHMRLRRLVNQAYSNEAINALLPAMTDRIERLLADHARNGACEVIGDIAEPLPIHILCDWMAVEEEARPGISEKVHAVRYLLDPGMMNRSSFETAARSMQELTGYFGEHAARLRKSGKDTLVARLHEARFDGKGLSDEEVAFACVMSFVAGTETTQCLIGNITDALLNEPGQFAALAGDDAAIRAAIEEVTRHETPLQFTKRLAVEDCSVGGIDIRAGEQILLCLGAANRDETVFEDADALRLQRSGPAHVGFGFGMHSCLGALLGRVQSATFLQVLLDGYEAFERVDKQRSWQANSLILRGPARLDMRFAARRGIA
ncbi:cytochrome P450 [Stappia sp.]|uniref:cytochrome P450 n=1 Tax=Stappia sp. TaxID=1870903 RepID=UPI003D09B522